MPPRGAPSGTSSKKSRGGRSGSTTRPVPAKKATVVDDEEVVEEESAKKKQKGKGKAKSTAENDKDEEQVQVEEEENEDEEEGKSTGKKGKQAAKKGKGDGDEEEDDLVAPDEWDPLKEVASATETILLQKRKDARRKHYAQKVGDAYLGKTVLDLSLDATILKPNMWNDRPTVRSGIEALKTSIHNEGIVPHRELPKFGLRTGDVLNIDVLVKGEVFAKEDLVPLELKPDGSKLYFIAGQHRAAAVKELVNDAEKRKIAIRLQETDGKISKDKAALEIKDWDEYIKRVSLWVVEFYDLDILVGKEGEGPQDIEPMLYLASNVNDPVVVEQKAETWTLAVKAAQSQLRARQITGYVAASDINDIAKDMKATDKNKRARILYEVDYVGAFVLSSYNQSPAFSRMVCNPSWVTEHLTNIYGKIMATLVQKRQRCLPFIMQTGSFETIEDLDKIYAKANEYHQELRQWQNAEREAQKELGEEPSKIRQPAAYAAWNKKRAEWETQNPEPQAPAEVEQWENVNDAFETDPVLESDGGDVDILQFVSADVLTEVYDAAFAAAFPDGSNALQQFGSAVCGDFREDTCPMRTFYTHLIEDIPRHIKAAAKKNVDKIGTSPRRFQKAINSFRGRLHFWMLTEMEQGVFLGLPSPRMYETLAECLGKVPHALILTIRCVEPLAVVQRMMTKGADSWPDYSYGAYHYFQHYENSSERTADFTADDAWTMFCNVIAKSLGGILLYAEQRILASNGPDINAHRDSKKFMSSIWDRWDFDDPFSDIYDLLNWDAEENLDLSSIKGLDQKAVKKLNHFTQRFKLFLQRYPEHAIKTAKPKSPKELFTEREARDNPAAALVLKTSYRIGLKGHDQLKRSRAAAEYLQAEGIRCAVTLPRLFMDEYIDDNLRDPIQNVLETYWGPESGFEMWYETYLERYAVLPLKADGDEHLHETTPMPYGMLLTLLGRAKRDVEDRKRIDSMLARLMREPFMYDEREDVNNMGSSKKRGKVADDEDGGEDEGSKGKQRSVRKVASEMMHVYDALHVTAVANARRSNLWATGHPRDKPVFVPSQPSIYRKVPLENVAQPIKARDSPFAPQSMNFQRLWQIEDSIGDIRTALEESESLLAISNEIQEIQDWLQRLGPTYEDDSQLKARLSQRLEDLKAKRQFATDKTDRTQAKKGDSWTENQQLGREAAERIRTIANRLVKAFGPDVGRPGSPSSRTPFADDQPMDVDPEDESKGQLAGVADSEATKIQGAPGFSQNDEHALPSPPQPPVNPTDQPSSHPAPSRPTSPPSQSDFWSQTANVPSQQRVTAGARSSPPATPPRPLFSQDSQDVEFMLPTQTDDIAPSQDDNEVVPSSVPGETDDAVKRKARASFEQPKEEKRKRKLSPSQPTGSTSDDIETPSVHGTRARRESMHSPSAQRASSRLAGVAAGPTLPLPPTRKPGAQKKEKKLATTAQTGAAVGEGSSKQQGPGPNRKKAPADEDAVPLNTGKNPLIR